MVTEVEKYTIVLFYTQLFFIKLIECMVDHFLESGNNLQTS